MSSTKPRNFFALVDCNNFFASCEQVFNPRLERKPLVILSSNDGMIIARSKKAKERGIKMGDPAYLYREEAERGDLVMLSANYPLYADLSRRVMQTLSSFSSEMEIYSIDEAFFLLEESNLKDRALSMKDRVKQWTGIPVSIGIGPTKTLSKLASKTAKNHPQGVFLLMEEAEIHESLKKTDVQDIWGIGRSLCERLKKEGIYTALQLQKTGDAKIKKLLGITGYRTALELRGIPCLELNESLEKKKSIVRSRSFGAAITTLPILHEAISTFTAEAAKRLREQGSQTSFLSVSLFSSEDCTSCDAQLPVPSSYTPDLIALAKEALARIYKPNKIYKKAGILLSDFSDREAKPMDLFSSDAGWEKKLKAMLLLDQINRRFKKETVHFAAEGTAKSWKSKASNVSPKFTTSWSDLLKI